MDMGHEETKSLKDTFNDFTNSICIYGGISFLFIGCIVVFFAVDFIFATFAIGTFIKGAASNLPIKINIANTLFILKYSIYLFIGVFYANVVNKLKGGH